MKENLIKVLNFWIETEKAFQSLTEPYSYNQGVYDGKIKGLERVKQWVEIQIEGE